MDDKKKAELAKIPLCKTKAGPKDGDAWNTRLREELMSLIHYVKQNKEVCVCAHMRLRLRRGL